MAISSSHQLPLLIIFTQMPQVVGCYGEVCWFQMPWPLELLEVDISVKDLVPVTIAAALWGPKWSTDNMAVMASLQQRSAKSSYVMHLMHCISLFSAFLVLNMYLEF